MSTHGRVQEPIKPRYELLDYIRGWGAMTVVLIHIFSLFVHIKDDPNWAIVEWLPSRALFCGSASLVMFFVLSGFALFLLFESMGKNYYKFVASRWLRLFPVYFASIVIAILLLQIYKITGYLQPDQKISLDSTNLIQHLLLIGPLDLSAYNGPIWSLVHEMRLSLLFPLIYYAVQKSALWSAIITSCISLTLGIIYIDASYATEYLQLANIQHTLHFATMFTYGAIVAKNRHVIIRKIQPMQPRVQTLALFVFLLVFIYVPSIYMEGVGKTMLEDIFTAICSASIIALVICVRNPPRIRTLEFLGKISFSLYVIHIPVLYCLRNYLGDEIPFFLLFILYLLVPILAATLLFQLLEKRTQRWSRTVRVNEPPRLQLVPEER